MKPPRLIPVGNVSLFPKIMLTSTFTPAAGERMGRMDDELLWTLARDAASSEANGATAECASLISGAHYYNYRFFDTFDMASPATGNAIPLGSTINSATLQYFRDDSKEIGGNGFNNDDVTTANIVASTQASGTSYANSDYSAITFSSKGSIAFASTSNLAYFSISITDLSIISLTGYTKLCLITGRDLSNSAPTGQNQLSCQNKSQANPPILTINYTLPAGFLLMF